MCGGVGGRVELIKTEGPDLGLLSRSWLCAPAFLAPTHVLFLGRWETLLHSSFCGRLTCREDPSYILLHSISLDGSRFPFLPLVSWWTPACSQCSVLCSRVTTILFQKLLLCCVPNQNLTSFWNLVYDLTVLGPSILHPLNFTNYQSLCKPVTLRQSYESFLLAGSCQSSLARTIYPPYAPLSSC